MPSRSAKRTVGADSRGSTPPMFRSTTRVRRSGKPPNIKFLMIKSTSLPVYLTIYITCTTHYFNSSLESIQNKIRISTSHFDLKIILPSRAMQFYIVLLPVATLLATTANAADCYSQGGSQTCLNSTDLLNYRNVS
jgi:hypothetical protein